MIGSDLIAAIVAGYDVAIRIGLAVNPSHRKRGFHTTGTASVFGAAGLTAKLCGADAERIGYALGQCQTISERIDESSSRAGRVERVVPVAMEAMRDEMGKKI